MKDVTKLTSEHVRSYIEDKLENGGRSGSGIERATLDNYCSAANKFQLALNDYSARNGGERNYDFKIAEIKAVANKITGPKESDSRAYKNADKLVAKIEGKGELLGRIIRESGTRISEVSTIREKFLLGHSIDKLTGKEVGQFSVKGKGGYVRTVSVSPATYRDLVAAVQAGEGKTSWNEGHFRDVLSRAAEKSDQNYEGPHGLRWSWAQDRHQELQRSGLSYEAALTQISSEMGHHRADITTHYLH